MADDWDQFPVYEPPRPADDWSRFAPVQQAAPAEDWSRFASVEQPKGAVFDPDEEERRRREKPPEAEGELATGAREFAHGLAPAAAGAGAGLWAGTAAGAAAGSIVPGLGTLAGAGIGLGAGLIAGLGTHYAVSEAQESGLKALGYDDSMQRAINAQTNPLSATAGSIASGVAGFGPGAVGTGTRLLSAGLMGGSEGISQYAQGEFDPAKLALATVGGAALARPYGWGQRIEAAGAQAGEQIGAGWHARAAERAPDSHGSAGPEAAAGTAEAQVPPSGKVDVGDPHQERSVGSERTYPNPTNGKPPEPGGGVTIGPDPALQAALDAASDRPAAPLQRPEVPPTEPAPGSAAEPPVQRPPDEFSQYQARLEQDFPNLPNADRQGRSVNQRAPFTARADDVAVTAEPPRPPATVREAIEQRGDQTAGDVLKNVAALRRQDVLRGPLSGRSLETSPMDMRPEVGNRILEQGAAPVEAARLDTRVAEALAGRAPPNIGEQLRAQQVARAAQASPADVGGAGMGGAPPPGGPGAPSPGPLPPAPPPIAQQLTEQPKRIWDSIKNIFAPQTRGPQARSLADQIRGAHGETTQLYEQTRNILEPHRATENAMDPEDLRKLVNRAQGGNAFPDWQPANAAQRTALTDYKNVADMWANKLSTLDRAKQMDWIENYLPGMYKNPDANRQFFQDMGRGGGAGSLNKKAFPDYEAARAAGLEPFSNKPTEMLDLYGAKMRNFIGKQDVMEKSLKSGLFMRSEPPVRVGAAGSPEPLIKSRLPPNYVESKTSPGIYMPEEVVHTWDNFNAPGLKGGRHKDLYEAVRNTNSLWTNLELSLNGYHAFTMANEGIISDVAMGIEKMAGGNIAGGLKTIAQAPAAFYTRAKLGTKVQQGYLDPRSSDPVTQALVQGGFRPIGRSHAADSMLAQKTFLNSLKDMPKQIDQAIQESKQGWTDAKGNVLQQVAFPFRMAQRAIATVSHPLFEVYIPKLKAGAAYTQMEHWREFNPDKIGTTAETEAARKIVDSVDNRFGEMITDHLFMNKVIQDMGVAGLRSFSWLTGSLKEIGGGAYSGANAAVRAAIERDPSRLNILNPANKNYDPRATYAVIAMPMTIAATSAIYQALLGSHDAPANWQDLYAPRTGGMVAGPGGSKVQEHMLMPGYHKDLYGWLAHPGTEAYNKLGGVWSTAIEEARGRGSPAIGSPPFIRPNATFTENVADRMSYLFGKMGPIGVKALVKGPKEGSEIPGVLTAAGFHPPGMEIQAPEKIHAIQSKQERREWKTMTRQANRDAMNRGRAPPYPPQP